MHHYEAKHGTVFNYDPDLGGEDRLISVPAADLVEFLDYCRERQEDSEAER